jgi:hypothetical protein
MKGTSALAYGTIFFLVLISAGCENGGIFEQDTYTSYTGISTTKAEIILENKHAENSSICRVYALLTNIDAQGAESIINDMGSASITFNGAKMKYGKLDGYKCFYPEDNSFALIPDSVYHVTIKDDTGIFDSYVKMPHPFEGLQLKDTVDISTGIKLSWTIPYPSYKIHALVQVYNPSNSADKILLLDEDLSQNDAIWTANSMSPFIQGWFGKVTLSRKQLGMSSLLLQGESGIIAKSSFMKQFFIQKSN